VIKALLPRVRSLELGSAYIFVLKIMEILTDYRFFGAIMAILFLEELRLSGSLGHHDGVTRRSFSRETKINLS